MEAASSVSDRRRWCKREISNRTSYKSTTNGWKTKCSNILCNLSLGIWKMRPGMLVFKYRMQPCISRRLYSSVADIFGKEEINEWILYQAPNRWAITRTWVLSVLSSGLYLCETCTGRRGWKCLICVTLKFGLYIKELSSSSFAISHLPAEALGLDPSLFITELS